MIYNNLKNSLCTLSLVSVSVLGLYAQDAPVETSDDDLLNEEEVYTLSPFEVETGSDVGYLATSTLAGTRIRTDLKDVGSAISVVTKEFMADTGATDNSTLLQYTTNAEVAGTRGTYAGLGNGTTLDESSNLRSPGGAQRVRGLAAADNTRDYFVSNIPWDSYIAGRVDIQRGPNSILFGLGSPAGIVNASIDKAEFYDMNEIKLRVGSYGSNRASFDVNRVLIEDTLAVRIEALMDHEKFRQDPAFEDDERIFAAFRWEPNLFKSKGARTIITGNFEKGEIDANRPRILPPYDSLTGWFKPTASNGNWSLENGMGKLAVINGYDAQDENEDSYPAGDAHYGMANQNTANYQPYLGGVGAGQQPIYFIDGSTGYMSNATAGYMNFGALNPDGSMRGFADGMYGGSYNQQFFRVNGTSGYAFNANLPLSGSGQYRDTSLSDPTIYNFYDKLIDGNNKWEMEEWTAYNLDLSQSFFNDRLAFNFVFDKQEYEQANESLLGGAPAITIDVMQNLQSFWATGASGETVTNENYGRPYVLTDGGSGRSYETERESMRASIFAEFRMEDITDNGFFVKLFGKHRFNGVVSEDEYFSETRSWKRYANSLDWTSFWNGYDATDVAFDTRSTQGVVYLGGSIADRSSASGSYIPSLGSNIQFNDSNITIFNPVWTASDVDPTAMWSGPTGGLTKWMRSVPESGDYPDVDYWTQASNPANYEGWTTRELELDRYNKGQNLDLLKKAAKALRKIESQAMSLQSFWWNDALVTTVGWRNDKVKDKDVQATPVGSNRSILDISDAAYSLPDEVADNQIFEDESRTYGAVLHLNRIFQKDFLPVNVSLSYNQSENFQVTSTRRDIYGNVLGNPSGETEDWGVLLSTKDNRFSLRVQKYTTKITNATSSMDKTWQIGRTITQGLRFRNVFLYDLGGYTWNTRETNGSYRNTWTNTYGDRFIADSENPTDAELAAAQAEEDAAIEAWNDIQAWMDEKGFFEAWGFEPIPTQYLTNRSTYEATLDANGIPASQYLPPEGSVVAYSGTSPQGFSVTEDSESTGYEIEFTANPTANWRIQLNASKTEATRNNVGGKNLTEWVEYMDSMFVGSNGELLPAALLPQWGNAGLTIYKNVYQDFRGAYALMKLNEGTPTPEIRKWRFNLITNYSFTDGKFKGLGVGASYRWADKAAIGFPVIEESANIYNFDFKNPTYGPSEDAIDMWFSYKRPINDKIDWKIQLNVRNVGQGDSLIPISVQPDGKTPAAYRIAPTQEWFLTNTFSF